MIQIVDIVLVVLFAAVLIKNWYTGFLKSVLSVVRLALTILICAVFGRQVAAWLEERYIHSYVYGKVSAALSQMAAQAADSVQQFFTDMKENYGVLVDTDRLNGSGAAQDTVDALADAYSDSITRSISGIVSAVAGYVLLFVVTFLVLSIVVWVLGKIVDLPVLRKCDRLLGLLLGLVIGFLFVCLVSTLLYGVIWATGDLAVYESSVVFRRLYDLHLFENMYDFVF